MKQQNHKGYLRITLSKENSIKTFSVHRLVALMFIPNPENKPEVNHKWGVKTDNKASELEWNTTSENMKHAYKTGLQKTSEKQREKAKIVGKNKAIKVIQYDLENNFIRIFASATEVERQFKIAHNSISACCRGKRKTAGGYIWKYKDAQ